MKLRQAKKIIFGTRSLLPLSRYTDDQVRRADRRYSRSLTSKECDRLWDEVSHKLRKEMGLAPLTNEEAARALDEATPEPLSEERIQEIVDYATRGG